MLVCSSGSPGNYAVQGVMVLLARSSIDFDRAQPEVVGDTGTPWFSTLTYRSRVALPMAELELHRLLRTAQARNRAEGITGILVYDRGCFFQRLEGPAEGLARVWDSVRRDPRHTAVEVLGNEPARQREFADWDLKLSMRDTPAYDACRGFLDIPASLLDDLYRHPEEAPTLLTRLSPARPLRFPVDGDAAAEAAEALARVEAGRATRTALLHVMRSVAIPHLNGQHCAAGRALALDHPRATELARLLLGAEPDAAADLVVQLHSTAGSMVDLFAHVFEPTARRLGDLWHSDDCSELQLTLALCRLQASMRELCLGATRTKLLGLPAVLVVPQPGEGHILGAALDSELLWRAGWDTHAEFPASDGALDAMVAGTWFDALDLSLSAAFRREHWLPRLAQTIAHARSASLNPALVVVVGGRVFAEPGTADLRVGADASCISAAHIESVIRHALPRGRLALLPSP